MSSTATDEEFAVLRGELRLLTDRSAISQLIDLYVITLDTLDKQRYGESHYQSIFTEDVLLEFPVGEFVGLTGLDDFHRENKAEWATTHHLSANHLVDIHGDRATARAQVESTHVHHQEHRERLGLDPGEHFFVGGYYDIDAVRTEAGWRLEKLKLNVTWTAGTW